MSVPESQLVPEVRHRFSLRRRVSLSFAGDAGLTKQSFAADADINNIIRRFVRTGVVEHMAKYGGEYGFATSQTFQEAMNVIAKANEMFAELPAKVRNRFSNRPEEFLEFVQDPANLPEMRTMGLAKPLVPPRAPPAPPPAAPAQ